ncbi:MAG: PorT family protein [Williamsia sp.]|nr:PorT family protein [Williamsia sp.]
MKKIFLAVALMTSSTLFAQTFQLGAKAGVNISNYSGTNFQTNSMIGFHVGGFINLKFGDVFSVQPEAVFSTQGAQYENAGTKSNLKVSYLNVPVMAKLDFGSVYIEAGPQVGFKTGESAAIPNQSINNFAKNLDLSAAAGIGYHSKSGLGIGARYITGISKVGDFNKTTTIDPDFKNSVVQLSVFFTLFNNK